MLQLLVLLLFSLLLFATPYRSYALCNANSLASFNACIASEPCGGEVVLANATYINFDRVPIGRNCTAGAKLTIRGASVTSAIFNGNNNEFVITGSHLNFKWLKFTNRTTNDSLADGIIQLKGGQFITLDTININGLSGEHGIVIGKFGAARDSEDNEIKNSIFENITATYGIRFEADTGADGYSKRLNFHDNIWRNNSSIVQETQFELGNNQSAPDIDSDITNNLFENSDNPWGILHPKVSGLRITKNKFINTYGLVLRQGTNNTVEDNLFVCVGARAQNAAIRINMSFSSIRRNVILCNNAEIDLIQCPFGTSDGPAHYRTCHNNIIADNILINGGDAGIAVSREKGGDSNDGPRNSPPHHITLSGNVITGTQGTLVVKHADVVTAYLNTNNHYSATGAALIGDAGTGSSTGDPAFISVTPGAVGAFQPSNVTASLKGPFRNSTVTSCNVGEVDPNINKVVWSNPYPPLVIINQANIDTEIDDVLRTATSSTLPAPLQTNITFGGAVVTAGQSVSLITQQNAVANSQCIGGVFQCHRAVNLASNEIPCGNTISSPPSTDCDRYGSPTGTGTACTLATPCNVDTLENGTACGQIACLLDGLYQGATQVISISGKNCSVASPLTIKCINDGKCRLDGQSVRRPIFVDTDSDGIVFEGLNLSNSNEEIAHIRGADVIFNRVIGWNAGLLGNAVIFSTSGSMSSASEIHLPNTNATSARNITFNQTAAFGHAQKQYQLYQTEGVVVRDSVTRYMCTQEPQPKEMFNLYQTRDAIIEDNIGTWNTIPANCAPTNSSQQERWFGGHRDDRWNDGGESTCLNNKMYGNVALLRQSDSTPSGFMFRYDMERCARVEHNLGWVQNGANHTAVEVFSLGAASDGNIGGVSIPCGPGTGGTDCNYHALNNTAIHNGNTPFFDADWIQAGNLSDVAPMDTATNPWTATTSGANLCLKFVNGVRTNTPRWPWPMNQRLINAMSAAGYIPYNVHTVVQASLGIIPQKCLTGSHEQVY